MSCTTCSTDIEGVPNGCKSNGTCASGSCNKLTVFDWLSNMTLPNHQLNFDHFEIRFKNGRKQFFKNTNNLNLQLSDVVAVETSPGHDIGVITMKGELVKVQMKKKKIRVGDEDIKQIFRKATQKDIDIWQQSRNKELEVQGKARLIVSRLGLKMKLSDVEYQGDGKKATFYYTADERVDFRLLIREMATTFGIRIEMKQVGLRQEASRLGGIGSCGRELCCSTWLTDFRGVNTSAARYQQLSLNPQKLSGQCGKLKCCLNYELDSYLDALKDFPNTDTWLQTEQGTGVFQKMDIFNGWIWYAYKDNPMHWHKLTVEQANEVIAINKGDETEKIKGKKVANLEDYSDKLIIEKPIENVFANVVGQDSLTRFDKPKSKRRRNNRNKNRNKKRTNSQNKSTTQNKNNQVKTKANGSKKSNQNNNQKPKTNNQNRRRKNNTKKNNSNNNA
jgi:cell fate regulator YaaT (PSP1 superfamily)